MQVFFPIALVSAAAKAFASRHLLTALRVFVEGLGAGFLSPTPRLKLLVRDGFAQRTTERVEPTLLGYERSSY